MQNQQFDIFDESTYPHNILIEDEDIDVSTIPTSIKKKINMFKALVARAKNNPDNHKFVNVACKNSIDICDEIRELLEDENDNDEQQVEHIQEPISKSPTFQNDVRPFYEEKQINNAKTNNSSLLDDFFD